MSSTIWVLTEEYNDYGQYGEYFVAAFKVKPTVEELQKLCEVDEETAEHIWNGGGQCKTGTGNKTCYEDNWHLLKEYNLETTKFLEESK